MAQRYDLVRIPRDPGSQQLAAPVYGLSALSMPYGRPARDSYWRHLVRVLEKHWRFSATFVVAFMIILAVVVWSMRDEYEAKARLEIEPQASETVSLRDVPNSAQSDQDYFQTQLEILRSDALALAVIRNLQLTDRPEIMGTPKQGHWVAALTRALHLEQPAKKSQKNEVERALAAFKKRLSVQQLRNSRLVEVGFPSENPELSAQVTNTLVSLYLEKSHRSKYESTMAAAGSLSGELEELRNAVNRANQALVDYQAANGTLDLNEADEGPGGVAKKTAISERVAELNRQLTQAKAERVQNESLVRMLDGQSAGSLPQMRDNSVVQELTKRYAESRAQLAQAQTIYGNNNPNVKKLQNQTDEIEAQINLEKQRVMNQVRTGYQAALTKERLLEGAISGLKGTLDSVNEKMIKYNLLKREAQANQDLYITLSSKLKELAISGALKSNNMRVLDQARPPDKPARPHRFQILGIGIVFSVFAGVILAFVRESFDDTICTLDDVRMWTGLPSLALVPRMLPPNGDHVRLPPRSANLLGNGRGKLREHSRVRFLLDRPHSAEAEAVRSLETSIRLPARPGSEPPRVILLVSSFPSEGKTTIAVNLAISLAQHGRACLVDADLRNPVVASTFRLSPQRGLADVLRGSTRLEDALRRVPDVPNLTILPGGPVSGNAGELVASKRMSEVVATLRKQFDHVVLDSPPIIPYADARWLSSIVDAVVLVARSGSTTRQAIHWSTDLLTELDAPVLGVVLNGVDIESEYHYYGSYSYKYKYE